MLLSELFKIMVNELTFVGFRRGDGPALGLPGHLKFFQGHFVFRRDTVGYFRGRSGHLSLWNLGLRTKNV